MIYWRYPSGVYPEYYFQVKDRMKAVLLYYILINSSEKSKFKMPKNYESLKQSDVVQKFHVVFKINTNKSEI